MKFSLIITACAAVVAILSYCLGLIIGKKWWIITLLPIFILISSALLMFMSSSSKPAYTTSSEDFAYAMGMGYLGIIGAGALGLIIISAPFAYLGSRRRVYENTILKNKI